MKYVTGSRESIVLDQRHALLEATRPYVERYHDEIFIGRPNTTLRREQMMQLVQYRLNLGNIEKYAGFPNVVLPDAPVFCVEALALEVQFRQQDDLDLLESLNA
ncbi:hypothetical protein PQR64_35785 [Paraburkholderia phytofirmans]|uniref:hypothetical protein n=1 Tax=Paraburkholderia phytofirmans TaxID=261302 RepID=UPI0038BDCCB9